jgi:V8-like Glu-specific endopeptidase
MLPPLIRRVSRRIYVRRTPLALFAIALALAMSWAASAVAHPVAHVELQPRDKIVRYWTPDRMNQAIPAERNMRPLSKPAKGGGGDGTSTGASSEVAQPYPSTYGKVFFTSNSGVNYVCSGSAIASANESVVWTAGHCVNEGPGGFYKNFLFVPAYRDGVAPYGKFAASTLLTTSGWQATGEFGVDAGAAVVGTNASGLTLSDAVAEAPLVFNAPRSQSYRLYGYPAAKRFSGQRMRVCETSWLLDDTSAAPATMGASCDMTGGSSGGAWVTASGAIASIVSYSYSSLRNVLFGPHLEAEAESLYATAGTTAG